MPAQSKSTQPPVPESRRVVMAFPEDYRGEACVEDVLDDLYRRLEALERREANGRTPDA